MKGDFYILSREETLELYNNYYVNGISSCKLAEMFGHTHKYYLNAFHKEGLEVRNNKINSRKYTVNHNYFNKIDSHEKAYWLGFIYADGYISSTNGKRFGLSLAIKDKEHLEKLKNCLESNYPVNEFEQHCGYSVGSKYCRLLISSDSIYDNLLKYGVYEHKTNILESPNIDEQFYPSFILGYFDGDGSIFLNKAKFPFYSINIVGTDNILTFIHNYFLNNKLVDKNINIEKRKENQTVSYIRYGGNILVEKILDNLYTNINSDLPLKRKYNLYIKCKNREFD